MIEVSPHRLTRTADLLRKAGIEEAEISQLISDLPAIQSTVPASRAAQAKDPPTFIQALLQGSVSMPAGRIRGTAVYTPPLGESKYDEAAFALAEKMESVIPESWRQNLNEAHKSSWFSPNWFEKLQASVGSQIPLLAYMGVERAIGKRVGMGLGGLIPAIGGAAIPGPEEAATVPTMAVGGGIFGGHFAGWAGLTLWDAGTRSYVGRSIGVNPEVADKWSALGAPPIAGVEYSQSLLMSRPLRGMSSELGKVAVKNIHPALVPVARELGVATIEGGEEVIQGLTGNKVYSLMIAEQNALNRERGLPEIDPDIVAENLLDAGITGAVVAAIIRGAGYGAHATTTLARLSSEVREVTAQMEAMEAQNTERAIDAARKTEGKAVPEPPTPKPAAEPTPAKPATAKQILGKVRETIMSHVSLLPQRAKEHFGKIRQGLGVNEWNNFVRNASPALIRKTASAMGIQDVVGRPIEDLRSEVRSRLPKYTEGPYFHGGDVFVKTPLVNPVMKADTVRGLTADKALRKILNSAVVMREQAKEALTKELGIGDAELDPSDIKTLPGMEPETAEKVYLRLWEKAIAREYGPTLASHTKMHPAIEGLDPDKPFDYSEVMPRDAYTRVVDNLIGGVRKYAKSEYMKRLNITGERKGIVGEKIANAFETDVARSFRPTHLLTKTGEVVKSEMNPQVMEQFGGWRPLFPLLTKMQSITGLRFLDFDYAMMSRERARLAKEIEIATLGRNIWNQVPKRWLSKASVKVTEGVPFFGGKEFSLPGKGKRLLNRVVFYKSTDDETQKILNKQYGIKPTKKQKGHQILIDNLIEEMEIPEDQRDEIDKVSTQMAADYSEIYQWFAQQGVVEPNRWVSKYAPRLRTFTYDPNMKSPLETQVRDHLAEDFSNDEVKEAMGMLDLVSSLSEKGYTQLTETSPFYEFSRRHLKDMLDKHKLIDDPQLLLEIYIRRALRKLYFEDVVPSVSAFMEEAEMAYQSTELKDEEKRSLRKFFTSYLHSVLGIPTESGKWMRSHSLRDPNVMAGAMINNVMNWWNTHPVLSQYYEFPESITFADLWDSGVMTAFGLTLGMPLNLTAPIKNILTQNVFSAVLGFDTYTQGMYRLLHDKDMQMRVKGMNLRMHIPLSDIEISPAKTGLSKFVETMLHAYRMSDLVNVYTAAAAAITAVERATRAWEDSDKTLTRDQLRGLLMDSETPPQIDEVEVMNSNISEVPIWKRQIEGPQFKGITYEVSERIMEGKVKEAEDLFAHFMVNLTQWRYGKGGTPAKLRDPWFRAFFMYTSWSLNYLDFMPTALRPQYGLAYRMVGGMAASLLMLSLLSFLPVARFKKAPMWMGTGPLPDSFGFTGPISDLIDKLMGSIVGGAKGMQEQALVWDESAHYYSEKFANQFLRE